MLLQSPPKKPPTKRVLKGVCHEIFDLYFFPQFELIWAPDKQAKVFSYSVSISLRYLIIKLKKFDSAVCRVKILGSTNQKNVLQFFSLLTDVQGWALCSSPF